MSPKNAKKKKKIYNYPKVLFGPHYLYWSILSSSVQFGHIRSIQSILSTKVLFSPIRSIWFYSVHFGPFGLYWSYSVHVDPVLSTLVRWYAQDPAWFKGAGLWLEFTNTVRVLEICCHPTPPQPTLKYLLATARQKE